MRAAIALGLLFGVASACDDGRETAVVLGSIEVGRQTAVVPGSIEVGRQTAVAPVSIDVSPGAKYNANDPKKGHDHTFFIQPSRDVFAD